MSKGAAGRQRTARLPEGAPPRHAVDGPALGELDELAMANLVQDHRPGDGDASLRPGQVLALQRLAGNRALSSLLAGRPAPGTGTTREPGQTRADASSHRPVQRHIGPTMPDEIQPGTAGTGTGTGGGGLDYEAIARRIRDAIEGLGTDEEAIYAALGQLGQDQTRITALQTAYRTLTGRLLDTDLEDDMSGDELARAQRLLHPPDRRQQIETLLRTTDTGRWAIGVIERWSIPVDYEFSGTGSFHQGGTIYINRTLSVDAAVLVMMHEAQHAASYMSGSAADVMTMARDAWVTAMIADEAEAAVRQIEGSVPMQAAGHSLVGSGISQGLIDRYRRAFYAHRDALEASDPTLSRREINARCRTHTRDTEVTSWFHDGTFVTSTGSITYSQHYTNEWNRLRNPPAATPASPAPETGE